MKAPEPARKSSGAQPGNLALPSDQLEGQCRVSWIGNGLAAANRSQDTAPAVPVDAAPPLQPRAVDTFLEHESHTALIGAAQSLLNGNRLSYRTSAWIRPLDSLSRPPSRPARTAMISARIESAV